MIYTIVNYWFDNELRRSESSSGGDATDLIKARRYAMAKSKRLAARHGLNRHIERIDIRETRGRNWGPIVARYVNGEEVELPDTSADWMNCPS